MKKIPESPQRDLEAIWRAEREHWLVGQEPPADAQFYKRVGRPDQTADIYFWEDLELLVDRKTMLICLVRTGNERLHR